MAVAAQCPKDYSHEGDWEKPPPHPSPALDVVANIVMLEDTDETMWCRSLCLLKSSVRNAAGKSFAFFPKLMCCLFG